MKQNRVSNDALRLSLFPYSLTHHATAWYDCLPRNSIQSFDDMMKKFLLKDFLPLMVTKLRNEITNFRQDPNDSLFEAWERCKLSIDRCPNHNILLVLQIDTFYNVTRDETSRTISSTTTTENPEVVRQLEMMNTNFQDMMKQIQLVKSVNPKCETCGGPHSFTECPAIDGYTQEAAYATTGSLPSNTVANPRGDLKAITTRSGVAYEGHLILPTSFSLPKEVKQETKVTKDKVQSTSSESTAHVQPLVVQILILELEVVPKPNPKPLIPYPLRLNDQ
nr:hypothetical protein [Tanacetum cinerariifolium]GEZ24025.1 hypothetical protein [Tanacetum cinerariifolium]